jgi:hypothetical protein
MAMMVVDPAILAASSPNMPTAPAPKMAMLEPGSGSSALRTVPALTGGANPLRETHTVTSIRPHRPRLVA